MKKDAGHDEPAPMSSSEVDTRSDSPPAPRPSTHHKQAARERLHDRRPSISFGLQCAGLAYVATISRFPDGRLGEIFLTNHKAGSAAEGDESSARDMGRFVTRCGELERRFDCLVAVVHHMGKNPAAGGRGSNALNGAADVTLTVEKGDA